MDNVNPDNDVPPRSEVEKARLFLDAAGLCQQSFDGRRILEWKLAFGQWAAIGIFTWFATSQVEFPIPMYAVVFVYAVIFVYCVCWNLALQISHRQDKDWKHYFLLLFETAAEPKPGIAPEQEPVRPPTRQNRSWPEWRQDHALPALGKAWLWGHCLITLALLVGSGFLINASNQAKQRLLDRHAPTATSSGTSAVAVPETPGTQLQDTLARIEAKLDQPTAVEYGHDVVKNFLWEYMINPLIAALLASLGSLSIVAKIAVKFRLRHQSQTGGLPSASTERLDAALNYVLWVFVVTSVVYFAMIWVAQAERSAPVPGSELEAITEQLHRIEGLLTTGNVDQRPVSINPILLLVTIVSCAGLIVLALASGRPGPVYETAIQLPRMPEESTRLLATPVILALILLVLPYPVDALILPFIVAYFIAAFFDIVALYPNPTLKAIVLKRYSSMIYLAHFGVWYQFLNTIRNFLEPFWFFVARYPAFADAIEYLNYVWHWSPLALALLLAVPGWRRCKQAAEIRQISAIGESLDTLPT